MDRLTIVALLLIILAFNVGLARSLRNLEKDVTILKAVTCNDDRSIVELFPAPSTLKNYSIRGETKVRISHAH